MGKVSASGGGAKKLEFFALTAKTAIRRDTRVADHLVEPDQGVPEGGCYAAYKQGKSPSSVLQRQHNHVKRADAVKREDEGQQRLPS